DPQPGAGWGQGRGGGDGLVGGGPATVGQMLAGRGLREPVRQGDAAAQGKRLGQHVVPECRSVLIHLTSRQSFELMYVVHVYRIVNPIQRISVKRRAEKRPSYQV